MLAKCFNPQCSAQFHYLGKGRLFRIEFGRDDARYSRKEKPFEYFWLCGECASTMTVAQDCDGHVHVAPRPLTDGATPLPLQPDSPRHASAS
ncbi:MAG: hypothetical protein P4M01_03870 [Acidobacteriota bacterium]|nr:hypothetical protein [Acidobacteriota bacterium]